jgi:hypothetical protein
MQQGEKQLMRFTVMESRRNKGNKNKSDIISKYVFTRLYMLLDRELYLEKYDGRK